MEGRSGSWETVPALGHSRFPGALAALGEGGEEAAPAEAPLGHLKSTLGGG